MTVPEKRQPRGEKAKPSSDFTLAYQWVIESNVSASNYPASWYLDALPPSLGMALEKICLPKSCDDPDGRIG